MRARSKRTCLSSSETSSILVGLKLASAKLTSSSAPSALASEREPATLPSIDGSLNEAERG